MSTQKKAWEKSDDEKDQPVPRDDARTGTAAYPEGTDPSEDDDDK
jgi:hypothetical protein